MQVKKGKGCGKKRDATSIISNRAGAGELLKKAVGAPETKTLVRMCSTKFDVWALRKRQKGKPDKVSCDFDSKGCSEKFGSSLG